MRWCGLAVSISMCASVGAFAWPVDWAHDVEAGGAKFLKLPALDWFEVDEPSVVSVEWMEEAKELLLIANRPGRALVLLGVEGKVAAWRVRVASAPVRDEGAMVAAKKACPYFTLSPLEVVKLTTTVKDEPCRLALMKLFQTDAFEARHLELTFEPKVLQQQLKNVEEGLAALAKGRVKARYVGAGLVLEGDVASVAEHRKVLWEVLKRTLGRFALDDRIVEPTPTPDAGTMKK
jgi:hypothetical protein